MLLDANPWVQRSTCVSVLHRSPQHAMRAGCLCYHDIDLDIRYDSVADKKKPLLGFVVPEYQRVWLRMELLWAELIRSSDR